METAQVILHLFVRHKQSIDGLDNVNFDNREEKSVLIKKHLLAKSICAG